MSTPSVNLAIVGAGAAGLAAAIFAGEAAAGRGPEIVLLEGAKKPGAKILVSGGGRCNVTNEAVSELDFCGGPGTIIRKVLKAFDNEKTLAWMQSLGVELKLEPTGKYFPVSDSAKTVLDALLRGVREVGVELRSEARVTAIHPNERGFLLEFSEGAPLQAGRVILAAGGRSLPKSGSDGAGLDFAERLGHSIVPTTQALVPLVLSNACPDPVGRAFSELSGLTVDARLELHHASGKKLFEWIDSMLFTHFGISGPGPMNLSRHWLRLKLENPNDKYIVTFGHPYLANAEAADAWLREAGTQNPKKLVADSLVRLWPARLARLYAENLMTYVNLKREARLDLARRLAATPLAVAEPRGWSFAETTAGGVELREIDARTMASRRMKNLFLCGEILDVDGRIGGFNFQWAWASGYLAGRGAAAEAIQELSET